MRTLFRWTSCRNGNAALDRPGLFQGPHHFVFRRRIQATPGAGLERPETGMRS